MDEEIIQELQTLERKLIKGIEIINSDISRLSLTRDLSIRDSVNNILVLFNGSLEIIDSLIVKQQNINDDDKMYILSALDITNQWFNNELSDDDKIAWLSYYSVILGLNKKLNENNILNIELYKANKQVIDEANKQLNNFNKKKKLLISKIKSFHKFLKNISNEKLRIPVDLSSENEIIELLKTIRTDKLLDQCYLCYLHELSNIYLYNVYNQFNIKYDNELLLFDSDDDYKIEIEKIINNVINFSIKNEFNDLKKETLIQLSQFYSILEFMGVNFKEDIAKCDTDISLNELIESYDKFVYATSTIIHWANYLENSINSVMSHIKIIYQEKGINYINNNYHNIIGEYIIRFIKIILNQKFNIEYSDEALHDVVKQNIKDYDNIDRDYIQEKINLIVKETIKGFIKGKIDEFPKKIFKNYHSISTSFNCYYDELYKQLYDGELKINDFIEWILECDEKYKKLKQKLDEEIELIKICWETDNSDIEREFTSFVNTLLEEYHDNDTQNWLLNYLKAKIKNLDLENSFGYLLTAKDKPNSLSNTENNNDDNQDNNISSIPYLIFHESIYNAVTKNIYNSNKENERYLSCIRECINYLLSYGYKKNNNKFALQKYQKTKSCWKLKKTNNETLTRIAIGFEKDNIIISSIFIRPKTEKKYSEFINVSENKIKDIKSKLQGMSPFEIINIIYESIIILKKIYEYIHTNISSLTDDDINYDNKLLLNMILKFKGELKNINYNILALREISALDKISKDISIIEDELNAKVLKKTKN